MALNIFVKKAHPIYRMIDFIRRVRTQFVTTLRCSIRVSAWLCIRDLVEKEYVHRSEVMRFAKIMDNEFPEAAHALRYFEVPRDNSTAFVFRAHMRDMKQSRLWGLKPTGM